MYYLFLFFKKHLHNVCTLFIDFKKQTYSYINLSKKNKTKKFKKKQYIVKSSKN